MCNVNSQDAYVVSGLSYLHLDKLATRRRLADAVTAFQTLHGMTNIDANSVGLSCLDSADAQSWRLHHRVQSERIF